jgi:hypothetical protein
MQIKQLYTDNIYTALIPSLPIELAKMILSYTHLLQPPNLTKDIEHFFATRKEIRDIYLRKYENNLHEDAYDWLSNDIIYFANDFYGTSYGLIPGMITKWRRLFLLKDLNLIFVSHIVNCFIKNKNANSIQINTFWGLFTPEERENMISINNNSPL